MEPDRGAVARLSAQLRWVPTFSSRQGTSRETSGSFGRPRTRSPMMFLLSCKRTQGPPAAVGALFLHWMDAVNDPARDGRAIFARDGGLVMFAECFRRGRSPGPLVSSGSRACGGKRRP